MDATAENNDVRLAVCAGCASGRPLSMLLRAIAAGVSRHGGADAEHKRVMDQLLETYRFSAGLPIQNGLTALIKRHQAEREQGNS